MPGSGRMFQEVAPLVGDCKLVIVSPIVGGRGVQCIAPLAGDCKNKEDMEKMALDEVEGLFPAGRGL